MKVAVFTATKRYGGLDVTYGALKEQTCQDWIWIVADDLFEERRAVFQEKTVDLGLRRFHFKPRPKPLGYYSDLPGIYNAGIILAQALECDLFVSLQDFIWVPPDGLERFVRIVKDSPGDLATGLCSMAAEPGADQVSDPQGLWSIFEEDYPGYQGEAIEWEDVRTFQHRPGEISQGDPASWEMNWSAVPVSKGPLFDESYGEHIGHENQQFAWRCSINGARILVDTDNHAISLPHRHYFPEEWAGQQPHREQNQTRFHGEYDKYDHELRIARGGRL